jgi:lipopolysaccharide biosynthesis regulator YciM
MRALLTLGGLALLAGGAADARRHDPEKLPLTHVRDLHYGDVLFYFFQNTEDTDLTALTRLLAYDHWGRLSHSEDDALLLQGGLYLELGMHNRAGEIFQSVLTNDVPTGVRNKAWFYLAQVWYARGYMDRAEGALRKINGRMSPELEAQRELLLANALMRQNRFDEAIAVLSNWRGPDLWSAYARFNLGIALVRNQRLADADPFLSAVGTMLAPTAETAALRDRANLALGFAFLQAGEPARARAPLERVRLNGPYSSKALLGMGWADAALGDYQGALTPWMALRERNLLDAAVQESYLAVPYAFGKMNANAQAANYYESAVNSFDAENTRLDGAIAAIERGDMLEHVLSQERNSEDRFGWAWQLKSLPDAPESRYLYTLLAGNDFQEGLKNFRTLVAMGGTLERHADDMGAFEDMIETRERAYAERLPRADALLNSGAVQQLQQRKVALDNRLRAIEAQHEVAALGTAEEREQWGRIQRIEAALAGAPDSPDNAELRTRLALVKGVLFFRLNDAYGARLWQEQRELKDLNVALQETQSRWIRVERARKNVPANTGEFAQRVVALQQRIDSLEGRLVAAEQKQRAYLAHVAVEELERQKERLATYQIQARFELGTMYDRAAREEAARPAKPAVPVQKGAEDEGAEAPAPPEPPK